MRTQTYLNEKGKCKLINRNGHTNKSDSVFRQKISIVKIYFIMLIPTSSCALLIYSMVSLSRNNCLNVFANVFVQTLHHYQRHEILFSVAVIPQLLKIAWILLMNTSFSFCIHLFVGIQVRALIWPNGFSLS